MKNKLTESNLRDIIRGVIQEMFDEDLQEEGYDDIKEKKKEYSAGEGWLGITDKYWLTALVPEKNQPFKGEFTYKNGFKAN